MSDVFTIAVWEYYMAIGFMVGFFLMIIFLFLVFQFTPAGTFFYAWFMRKPLALVMFRTGMASFLTGSPEVAGSMEVNKIGFAHLTEGSTVRENKSKLPMFLMFAEYGLTIPLWYAPILQEIREHPAVKKAGYVVSRFSDYVTLLKCSADRNLRLMYCKRVKDKEKAKNLWRMFSALQNYSFKVRPFKTYKVHELAQMFPNNISPVYVDQKVQSTVFRRIKMLQKRMLNNQLIIYSAIAVLIIVIAGVIAYRYLKAGDPTVVVQTVDAGVQALKNTGNLTA